MSNYYNCKDATGKVYQLWYDNGKSSQLKYELAMSYGAKGVGRESLLLCRPPAAPPLLTRLLLLFSVHLERHRHDRCVC